MDITTFNGVRVYNVTAAGSRLLPAFMAAHGEKVKKLSNTESIDILQEFEFPSACTSIAMSADGRSVIATGSYKPMVKVWSTEELTLKFSRTVDAEIIRLETLVEDWKKFALLHVDRTLSFHAQFGQYCTTRIPCYGRDLCYDHRSCELYAVGMSSEIFRLNLEEGRFQQTLAAANTDLEYIRSCDRQKNGMGVLLSVGGANGVIEMWDLRSKTAAASISLASSGEELDITKVRFSQMDALSFAAGDSSGKVHLFDLRSSKPLFSKDHHYDTPITQIQYHSAGKVISSCEQAVRIWDSKTGAPFTAMEPFASAPSKHGSTVTNSLSIAKKKKRLFGSSEMYQGVTARSDQTADFSGRITDFCLADAAHGHGLVMVAGDCPHVQAYFVPDLGPAPRWVSFLEALAEDDAKGAGTEKNTLYADYKFVTREELDRLGLGHLIGTDLLRAYMHGFFMDMRLYRKARDVSDPFEYARWRDEQIAEKIRKERESRVKRDAEIAKEKAVAEIKDPRFMRMVEDADFAVDQESAEFKRVFTNKRRREEDYGSDEEDLNAKKQGSKSEGDEDSDAEAEEQVYDESILDKQIAAVEAEDDGSSEDEDKIRKVYLDPLAKKRKMRDERSAAKEEERKKLAAEAQAKEEEKKKMRRLTMDERLKIEEERRAKEVKEKERENKRRIFKRHGGDDRRRMDFGKKKR